MAASLKIKDHYADIDDFDDLLDTAEAEAAGEWEEGFVLDIQAKYAKWGAEMFLSEHQKLTLERIAEP